MLERLFLKRYLWNASKSSAVRVLARISVFGIALGVLTMIVVLSVMGGFDEAIENRILKSQPHLVITGLPISEESMLTREIPKASIDFFSRQDVIIRTIDGVFSGAVAYGTGTGRLNQIGKRVGRAVEVVDVGNGEYKSGPAKNVEEKIVLDKGDVALGVDLARSLGIFEGDDVTIIAPESLLVPGEAPIYEKAKVRALIRTDVNDMDSKTIYFDRERGGLKRLRDTASLETGFEVRLSHPQYAADIKDRLIEKGITGVKTWEDLNAALFYSLKMERRLMGMFLGVTILISSFSIMSVLFLLVTEKEKDVGILKAIGAKKSQIVSVFIYIGLILGSVGIGGGVVLGLFLCWLIKTYPIISLPDVFLDTHFPVKVEMVAVFGIIFLGMVLTLITSVGPALKISKSDPIDSLRS